MSLWKWLRTAAGNASADSSINWAEGQPPSSVNDSARAMMAAVAKYRDDISGAIATGGTSTAYTVSTYQVFDSLAHMDGALIAFTPHITNGATVTLNTDSLGAKPLRAAPGVELQTGALIQGTPYVATYNNSDAVWYLHPGVGYNSYSIPLGGMLPYIGISAAPNSAFAFPYGQAISRATYATLFSLVGTQFGTGDGSTTFNLPDLRGRVWAGLDNMGGSSASRLTSATIGPNAITVGGVGGAQTQTILQANLPSLNFTVTDTHRHAIEASDLGYGSATAVSAPSLKTNGAPPTGSTHYYDDSGNFDLVSHLTSTTAGGSGSITVASGGSGTALNTTQPTMVGNFILRII